MQKFKINKESDRRQLAAIFAENGYAVSIEQREARKIRGMTLYNYYVCILSEADIIKEDNK